MGYTQISFVERMLADTFAAVAAWSHPQEKSPVCERTVDQKMTTVFSIAGTDHYTLATRQRETRKRYEGVTTCYYQLHSGNIVGVCEKFAGFDGFHYDPCKSVMAGSFSKCLYAYEIRWIDTFTNVIKQLCGVLINEMPVGQAPGHLAVRMELPMPVPQPPKNPPPAPPGPDGMPPA